MMTARHLCTVAQAGQMWVFAKMTGCTCWTESSQGRAAAEDTLPRLHCTQRAENQEHRSPLGHWVPGSERHRGISLGRPRLPGAHRSDGHPGSLVSNPRSRGGQPENVQGYGIGRRHHRPHLSRRQHHAVLGWPYRRRRPDKASSTVFAVAPVQYGFPCWAGPPLEGASVGVDNRREQFR